jgi:excisionase family DNA binding protein
MRSRTQTRRGDRPEDGSATARPRCRRLFCVEQAAAYARVPTREICRWIKTHKLEAYRLAGGRIRIDEVELAEFLSSPESKQP